MSPTPTPETVHPNVLRLQTIYADLTRLEDFATDSIVLHTADRRIANRSVSGKEAVMRQERELIRRTRNTLIMDTQHIAANDFFGIALGTMRARMGTRDIEMPFCGLWRFRDGWITEHWENAYDPLALRRLLTAGAART
ncbi:nuclear transport factor 2 family protein [Streptomyces wuyuanensis]|uniref:nuclear transport factor 2 family protein n=1 Tax=Streptomyces wuyuanensis TaxID=1196353 RepID=UPI0036BCE653